MAKQNPATDPVSAAMSAIESALNLTDDETSAPPVEEAAPPASLADPGKTKAPTPILKPSGAAPDSAPLLRPGPQQTTDAEGKPAIAATPPANDDRETVGAILQALNTPRPSRTPFVLAIIGSLVWAAVCALYAYLRLWPEVASAPVAASFVRPETALLLLATLGPIFFIFAFATLARRLRELRQSARAISEVAVRLVEPETIAGDHVATLSHAIRRELNSMGDGVERALARAAELETQVKAEVSTLERSYSDNERKIRSLIAEMADQREAIVTSGSRVRDAISNAHGGISGDLDAAGDRLSEKLNEASRRLTAALGSTSDDIAISMDRTGSTAVERIVAEGAQIAISIAGVGDSLAARLAETSRRTADDIVARVGDLDGRVKAAGDTLLAGMDARGNDLVQRINASQTDIVDAIGAHGDRVTARIAETSAEARDAVGGFTEDMVGRIAESSARAAEAIQRHGDSTADRLADASATLSTALGANSDEMVDRLRSSGTEVVEAIRTHGGGVTARLAEFRRRGCGGDRWSCQRSRRTHHQLQRPRDRGDPEPRGLHGVPIGRNIRDDIDGAQRPFRRGGRALASQWERACRGHSGSRRRRDDAPGGNGRGDPRGGRRPRRRGRRAGSIERFACDRGGQGTTGRSGGPDDKIFARHVGSVRRSRRRRRRPHQREQ